MYVHVLMVLAGVEAVPLVDVGLRDVLTYIFLKVVGNSVVLAQRRQLNRLLLDLQMLWQ